MSVRRTPHAPLRARNSFGIDARAELLIDTDDTDDLPALFARELAGAQPLVLGGGSNLLIVEGPRVALARACGTRRALRRTGRPALVRQDSAVDQTTPWASMASATFTKPAMLAPST